MREGPRGGGNLGPVVGADGTHGAGHQGHGGPQARQRIGRLRMHPGTVVAALEGLRGELVAGAAVDAGAVHEKGAWGVVSWGIRATGHVSLRVVGC